MPRIMAFLTLLAIAGGTFAHHGAQSQFDQNKSMAVSGVVTKIRFVNPHSYVYFDVSNDDGTVDAWRCEMRAATVLKRSGWSADIFTSGSRINIEGVPARREPHGCYVNRFSMDDGAVVERYQQLDETKGVVQDKSSRSARLMSGKPNLAGDWAAPQRLPSEQQVRDISLGRASRPRGTRYQQSQAGIDASAGYEREDNPRFHCMPTNIFMDWIFDQHINRIEQSDDTITLTYGFMDIVRTIHLDLDQHPADVEPTRAGHSIGHWDDDTLVIDTVGFAPGYLNTRTGARHSDQLHTVERFTMDPEEISLARTYSGEDPLYLSARFEGQDKIFLSETPFDPYNCEDLTDEIVEGF